MARGCTLALGSGDVCDTGQAADVLMVELGQLLVVQIPSCTALNLILSASVLLRHTNDILTDSTHLNCQKGSCCQLGRMTDTLGN